MPLLGPQGAAAGLGPYTVNITWTPITGTYAPQTYPVEIVATSLTDAITRVKTANAWAENEAGAPDPIYSSVFGWSIGTWRGLGYSNLAEMPVGNLAGPAGSTWVQRAAIDFDTPVAEGGFVADVNGNLTSAGAAGFNAYGGLITMYPKLWAGSGTKTSNNNGIWDESIISVSNSQMHLALRTLDYLGTPTPRGAAFHLNLPGYGDAYNLGPYGKYLARLRARTNTGTSASFYHSLLLAIRSSNWENGEFDWMECDFSGTMSGWDHTRIPPTPPRNAATNDPKQRVTTTAKMSDWNNVGVEWTPDYVKWTYQGDNDAAPVQAHLLTDTSKIPNDKMAVLIQCEPTTTTPAAGTTATLDVDWFTVYSYQP